MQNDIGHSARSYLQPSVRVSRTEVAVYLSPSGKMIARSPPSTRRLAFPGILMALLTAGAAQGAGSGNYNVLNYGADPSGIVDATNAINLAIADALAATTGGTVYLPAGTYKVNSGSLNIATSSTTNITVQGAGGSPDQNSVLMFGAGSVQQSPALFNISGTGMVRLSNLAMTQTTQYAGQLVLNPSASLLVRGCSLTGTANNSFPLLQTTISQQLVAQNAFNQNFVGTGIAILVTGVAVGARNVLITDNVITGNGGNRGIWAGPSSSTASYLIARNRVTGSSVEVDGAQGTSIVDNSIVAGTGVSDALTVSASVAVAIQKNHVSSNSSGATSILLNNAIDVIIDSNVVLNSQVGTGLVFTGTRSTRLNLTNNSFTGPGSGTGVNLGGSTTSNVNFLGNVINGYQTDVALPNPPGTNDAKNICVDTPGAC